jgi:mono/diheme cytochrome c family protein
VDYPIWSVSIGGGMLMAIVAIAHVIVSHFAIGGGLVIAVTETLAVRRGDQELRELARRGSLMLILVSTVFGAISGVGIWVVAGLISPGAISALIHNYVWGWAIEWTFFVVEIIAALIYYVTWGKISKAAHLMVGWIYFVAAYLSLVVINGIITFMLTPGRWLETRAFWDGFFNPTYWPALVLRTGICAMMATAFLIFVARGAADASRARIVRYLGWWLVAGCVLAYAGYRWWEAALPETVLNLFRGTTPAVAALASTRSLALWALAAALVLGGLLLVALPRAGRTAVAVVISLAAFTFFGSYERLREGTRKPFLIHSHLFSNGLRIDDIERVNEQGMTAYSGWVSARSDEGAEAYGREVFAVQCSACHTLDGYLSIRSRLPTTADMLELATDDPPGSGQRAFRSECGPCHADYTYEEMKQWVPPPEEIREDPDFVRELNAAMIAATLERLREMGQTYSRADPSRVIDTHETAYPYMPPLVGTDEDLEALAAYLASLEQQDPAAARVARRGGAR